jgi:hypothetical protein
MIRDRFRSRRALASAVAFILLLPTTVLLAQGAPPAKPKLSIDCLIGVKSGPDCNPKTSNSKGDKPKTGATTSGTGQHDKSRDPFLAKKPPEPSPKTTLDIFKFEPRREKSKNDLSGDVLPPWTDRFAKTLSRPEVAGLRIGWHVNATYRAFKRARDQKKLLVFFFNRYNCAFCQRLLEKFTCPYANAFAGRAVFALTTQGKDNDGQYLADLFGSNAFPSVFILRVTPDRVTLVGRLVGDSDNLDLQGYLADTLKSGLGAEPLLDEQQMREAYRTRGMTFDIPKICKVTGPKPN